MSREEAENAILDQKRLGTLIIDQGLFVGNQAAEEFTYDELLVRLDLLEKQWENFVKNDLLVRRYSEAFKERTFLKSNQYTTVESSYVSTKVWFASQMSKKNPARVAATGQSTIQTPNNLAVQSTSGSTLPLEPVHIPTFSGKQKEWETYKEQFEAMVQNGNIPPVLKFRTLFSSLDGDAVRPFRVVAENFDLAWATLCEKCDNKPLHFFIQMHSLEELSITNQEPSDHLSSLLNAIEESIVLFNDLDLPTTLGQYL